jgi:small subunit ribosomal protein S9
MTEERYYATGKRKTAIAKVWLKPGSGQIVVNKRDVEDFFERETLRMILKQPLVLTANEGRFDISVNVNGGGIAGQADAIKHGISKALLEVSPDYRAILKKEGFLTRDARIKERKKYGQKGARARFQFSKR